MASDLPDGATKQASPTRHLPSAWLMNGVILPIHVLWKYRRLLMQTTWSDLQSRFAGSVLGLTWLTLYPLVLLAAYALVYVVIFRARFPGFDGMDYVALMFCGLVPFLGFAEALNAAVPSLTSNAHLIKNSLFPMEMIPVKAVLVSQSKQVVAMVLLILALLWMGRLKTTAILLLPLWGLQVMGLVGMAWILAAVNTYVRDIQAMTGLVTMLLMMVSPIAYTADMVPERLRPVLELNPLYYLIIPWQDVLMRGTFPESHTIAVLTVLAVVTFIGGYWFFSRLRSALVDHV